MNTEHELAPDGIDTLVSNSGAAFQRDIQPDIIEALGALPSLEARILMLHYWDEYSIDELATRTGMPFTQVEELRSNGLVAFSGLMRGTKAGGLDPEAMLRLAGDVVWLNDPTRALRPESVDEVVHMDEAQTTDRAVDQPAEESLDPAQDALERMVAASLQHQIALVYVFKAAQVRQLLAQRSRSFRALRADDARAAAEQASIPVAGHLVLLNEELHHFKCLRVEYYLDTANGRELLKVTTTMETIVAAQWELEIPGHTFPLKFIRNQRTDSFECTLLIPTTVPLEEDYSVTLRTVPSLALRV
jgi:hypothetical protein